jgi:hypothetical protein
VKAALAQKQADVFSESISADISEQLDAGHQVAYKAISSMEVLVPGALLLAKMK